MTTRAGYTLVEVLLVLTLLLVLGALAVSRLEGLLERQQIREAAESVRQQLNQGRLRAAETGSIYQFVAANGDGNYALSPLESSGSDVLAGGQVAGALPATLRFQQVAFPGSSGASANPAATAAESPWCTPILFFPDGTSSGGAIDVVDQDDRFTRLVVRALTAVCSVGEPQRKAAL